MNWAPVWRLGWRAAPRNALGRLEDTQLELTGENGVMPPPHNDPAVCP